MGDATLVHSTSAERTRDAEELASLRPIRPKKARQRKPAREPMDRSLTFFCSNPQCDHGTWSPHEQAQHMAREFWEVTKALVRLAPDSPEAMKLTGGVILSDLTDDECREVLAKYGYYGNRVGKIPVHVTLIRREYVRRQRAGELQVLTPAEAGARRTERVSRARVADGFTDDDCRWAAAEKQRLVGLSLPVPDDVRRARAEYERRLRNGLMSKLSPEDRMARSRTAGRKGKEVQNAQAVTRRTTWPPDRIRAARAELGLSQIALAKIMEVSTTTIWHWETGKTVPAAAAVRQLQALLK